MWISTAAWVAYVLGWLVSIRPTLRRHMRADACRRCRLGGGGHNGSHMYEPRGSISDRDGRDALWAVWYAAFWPLYLLVFVMLIPTARVSGRLASRLILGGPLTMVEMERHERERTPQIAETTEVVKAWTDHNYGATVSLHHGEIFFLGPKDWNQ